MEVAFKGSSSSGQNNGQSSVKTDRKLRITAQKPKVPGLSLAASYVQR